MFKLFKKRPIFDESEQKILTEAIRLAELETSGEVRLYVEQKCKIDPLQRAVQLFYTLKMDKTAQRNGVIIYVSMKDKKLAIYGDEGIHKIVGQDYWNNELKQMKEDFGKGDFIKGLTTAIEDVGQKLKTYFPFHSGDKNELPDDIVFGK